MRTSFLTVGEPAPWFLANCTTNPRFHFDSVAGRYVVLCFFQSAGTAPARRILDDLVKQRAPFDDERCCFFGVSMDPDDLRLARVQELLPGVRYFWDFDQNVSRLYGVIDAQGVYQPCTYVLDERLRVAAVLPVDALPETHVPRLLAALPNLPPIPGPEPARVQAPVLIVPRVFEPELCRTLIAYFDQNGGGDSGFMREVDGRTLPVTDYGFKRRRDQHIEDEQLRNAAMFRLSTRLAPEMLKAFQFHATRIERHMVACYDSATGGYFRPHRDNTTRATSHRRFAVSLNLNTGEYDGGLLRFPEFGQQTYTAPAGGAVVFSCSLLHEATPVTRGRRYAYLPFLYDEAAAKIGEQNIQYLGAKPANPPAAS
jgi:peroxiredoxin